MTASENKVHLINCLDGLRQLPEKCANLIICDPPYYRVKGDFDFRMTWKEWLNLHRHLARECKRVLADNGTLFIYGHAKKIAYQQVIFDRLFNLENSITWHVYDLQTNKGVESFRCFAPVTERVLMYSNETERTGLESIKLDTENFKPLRTYFQHLQEWTGRPKRAFIDAVGQSADHCFRWGSTQWDMPTPETYAQLIAAFGIDKWAGFREYEDLRREYEDLRREYEDLRRPFNNYMRLADVWRFSQEAQTTTKYDHDTPKPEKLTRALILTCSRKNDLVVVPFAGSGTECAMAAKEGRRFIGFEIEQKYVDMSNERARVYLEQKQISLLDFIDL